MRILALIPLLAASFSATAQVVRAYNVQVMEPLPGAKESMCYGMDENGRGCGESFWAGYTRRAATVWPTPGTPLMCGPDVPEMSYALDWNANGQAAVSNGFSARESFLWTQASGRQQLVVEGQTVHVGAEGIDNQGRPFGHGEAGGRRHGGYWSQPNQFVDLGFPPNRPNVHVYDGNESGSFTGQVGTVPGYYSPATGWVEIPTEGSAGYGISSNDWVVGGGGWLWRLGQPLKQLPNLKPTTAINALDVNADVLVVGMEQSGATLVSKAFAWTAQNGTYSLTGLASARGEYWPFWRAYEVDDQGRIAGGLGTATGAKGFVATPSTDEWVVGVKDLRVRTGSLVSGSVADLFSFDELRARIAAGPIASLQGQMIVADYETSFPAAAVTAIAFRCSIGFIGQDAPMVSKLQFYDYVSGTWSQVAMTESTYPPNRSSTQSLLVETDVERYRDAEGRMKVRLSFGRADGSRLPGFTFLSDQAHFHVIE